MNKQKENSAYANMLHWISVGALLAGMTVALGALGAHFVKDWLAENFPDDAPRRLELWQTAARYQMYQSLGLILIGLITVLTTRQRNIVGLLSVLGIIVFSGFMFTYVVTNIKLLIVLVPIGGFSMIGSWLLLAWFVFRASREAANR